MIIDVQNKDGVTGLAEYFPKFCLFLDLSEVNVVLTPGCGFHDGVV